ncbi:MAG: methyltransferase domain-containing protein [Bradymonadaceae bacterium]|nr:methyltransferase domain-containing protein [Lujinxingiaceae bacterium]
MAKKKEQVLEELAKVKSIGPHLAEELYETLKIRSLEELVEAGQQGRLTKLNGVGEKTEKTIVRSAQRHVSSRNGASGKATPAKITAAKSPADKTTADKKPASTDLSKAAPATKTAQAKPAADKKPASSDLSKAAPAAKQAKAPASKQTKTQDVKKAAPAAKTKAQSNSKAAPAAKPKPVVKQAKMPATKSAVTGARPVAEKASAPSPRPSVSTARQASTPSPVASAAPSTSQGQEQVQPSPGPTRLARSLSARFIDTLRCPACGHDDFSVGSTSITCMSCQRQFSMQNGIADLAPPHVPDRSVTQRIMELRFYAQFYEDVMRPRLTGVVSDRTLREEYRLAADYLELDEDSRLLDVACGTANFTRYFAERLGLAELDGRSNLAQPLLVGMDLSWPMLETARNYLRREGLEDKVLLLRGDATRIPVKRGSYNRVHCAAGLHMMSDIDEALRNFARVLEPDGVCVIGTFILGEGVFRRFVKRVAEIPTKFHWFSREELHRRMERAGFEIVDESISGDAITLKARRV